MTKYKPTIEIGGEEMGLYRAWCNYYGLKFRILKPNLTEKEKKGYLAWKNFKENRNELSKKTKGKIEFKNLSERKYIVGELERKIMTAESMKKVLNCEKRGYHIEKKNSEHTHLEDSKITYVYCSKCGIEYKKDLVLYKNEKTREPITNVFVGK
jgi:hypothetical protein